MRGTRAAPAHPGRMIGYTYQGKYGHTTMITLTSEVLLSLRSDPVCSDDERTGPVAGKHSRTRIFSSPAGIVATAAVGVALAVGGTVGAVQLTSGSEPVGAGGSRPHPDHRREQPHPQLPGRHPERQRLAERDRQPVGDPVAAGRLPGQGAHRRRRSRSRPTKKTTAAAKVLDSGSCGASFYSDGQLTANGEIVQPERADRRAQDTAVQHQGPGDQPGQRQVGRRCGSTTAARSSTAAAWTCPGPRSPRIASVDVGALTVRYEVLG